MNAAYRDLVAASDADRLRGQQQGGMASRTLATSGFCHKRGARCLNTPGDRGQRAARAADLNGEFAIHEANYER